MLFQANNLILIYLDIIIMLFIIDWNYIFYYNKLFMRTIDKQYNDTHIIILERKHFLIYSYTAMVIKILKC